MATAPATPKLSAVPLAAEVEAAAAAAGTPEVVGGSLIAGGVQWGTYRDGVLVPADNLAQTVDFMTGLPLKPNPIIEGAAAYVAEGKDPVKLAAKKAVRTAKKTAEAIDAANAMSPEEEAAQQAAEDAANAPPPAPAPAPAPAGP
jgi:hypothetical protein